MDFSFKARQAACRAALCLGGRLRASLGRELGLRVLSSPSSPFRSLPFANIWGRDSGIWRRLWGTSPSCVGPPTCLHLPSLIDPSSSTLYVPCRGLSHRQGPRVTAQEPGASPGRRWPGHAASLGAATLAPLCAHAAGAALDGIQGEVAVRCSSSAEPAASKTKLLSPRNPVLSRPRGPL